MKKELLFYIIAAIGGGIVAEINSKKREDKQNIKKFFVRGATSVMIGVIFGLTIDEVTKNFNLTIAMTALAGVVGFSSLEWLIELVKKRIESLVKRK